MAKLFANNIKEGGFELHSNNFFDTVTIKTNEKTKEIYKKAISERVNLRKVDNNTLSVAFDEAKRIGESLVSTVGIIYLWKGTNGNPIKWMKFD